MDGYIGRTPYSPLFFKSIWRKQRKNLEANMPKVIFAIPYKIRRVGQGVKTPPFHGGITGSNPVRATRSNQFDCFFLCLLQTVDT